MTRGLPEFGEVMEAAFGARMGGLRAVDVGEVVSWNKASQKADIRPVILTPDGGARATVYNCAVVFPGAYWDIQVGETGLLLVCDSDYRRWWRTGEDSVPATAATHRIGNSVFLPGLHSLPGKIPSIPTGALVLEKPKAAGSVRLGDPSAFRKVVHDRLLTYLKSFTTALDTWGSTTHASFAAQSASFTANVSPRIATLEGMITAGDYVSPTVKVED